MTNGLTCAVVALAVSGLAVAADRLHAQGTASDTIGILLAAGDVARCTSNGTPTGLQKETAALIAKQIEQAPAACISGVLKIELKKDRYSWTFLPVDKTAPGQKKTARLG